MAVIGTFSSFTTARLGIYASQAALNVTGNNISNINTPGYTRQRLDLVSLYSKGAGKFSNIFDTNVGYGVLTNGRTQLRDPFLDIRYRNENANLAANEEKLDGLYQMSHTLDEVNKGTGANEGYGVIEGRFKNFIESLQKLHDTVGSQELDSLVRGDASSLVNFFRDAANALQSVYDGKMKDFDESIVKANMLLTDIRDLNEEIRTQDIYGSEALELRDQRNRDLDELSAYLHINVEYSMEKIDQFSEVEKLTVTIAGSKGPDGKPIKLIDGIYGGQLSRQEMEPLMNPNYDAQKIKTTMDTVRKEEETKIQFPDNATVKAIKEAVLKGETFDIDSLTEAKEWAGKLQTNMKAEVEKAAEDAQKFIESNSAYWTAREAEVTKARTAQAIKKAMKEHPVPKEPKEPVREDYEDEAAYNDAKAEYDTLKEAYDTAKAEQDAAIDLAVNGGTIQDEEGNDVQVAGAIQEAKEQIKGEKQDVIDSEKKQAASRAVRDTKEAWTKKVDEEVAKDSRVVETVGKYGKYLASDGRTAINEIRDANGEYLKDKDGNYIAALYDNDKLLLQVDPLEDRRGRLMIDSGTVSKRSEVVELNDTVLYGKLQSMREMLTEEGDFASYKDLNQDQNGVDLDPPRLSGDPEASSKRGIPYYQQALDSLVRKFAEEFNQANQLPATTVYKTDATGKKFVDKDGKVLTYTYTEEDANGNLQTKVKDITIYDVTKVIDVKQDDGTSKQERVPYDMYDDAKIYGMAGEMLTVLAKEGVKDPLYEFYDGGVLFSTNGNSNDPSGITASNISISHAWANNAVHILNDKRPDSYREDGTVIKHSSRNENIQHMITLFDKQLEYNATDIANVPGDESAAKLPLFTGSFREVYTAICGVLGQDQNVTSGKVDNYSIMSLNIENDRQSVSSVDLNDEATNMMVYSKSYSAACRLLTVIDEMLDKLINGTAL